MRDIISPSIKVAIRDYLMREFIPGPETIDIFDVPAARLWRAQYNERDGGDFVSMDFPYGTVFSK